LIILSGCGVIRKFFLRHFWWIYIFNLIFLKQWKVWNLSSGFWKWRQDTNTKEVGWVFQNFVKNTYHSMRLPNEKFNKNLIMNCKVLFYLRRKSVSLNKNFHKYWFVKGTTNKPQGIYSWSMVLITPFRSLHKSE
jgi:hypothetical protein